MMDGKMRDTLTKWPSQEALQKQCHFVFVHVHYGLKVVSIIDCFELFIEKPSNLLAKSCILGHNTSTTTQPSISDISITPQGAISFNFCVQGIGWLSI